MTSTSEVLVAIDIKAERQLRLGKFNTDIEVLTPSRNRHQSRKAIETFSSLYLTKADWSQVAIDIKAERQLRRLPLRLAHTATPAAVAIDIKAERQLKCGRDGARPSLFAVAMDSKGEGEWRMTVVGRRVPSPPE